MYMGPPGDCGFFNGLCHQSELALLLRHELGSALVNIPFLFSFVGTAVDDIGKF